MVYFILYTSMFELKFSIQKYTMVRILLFSMVTCFALLDAYYLNVNVALVKAIFSSVLLLTSDRVETSHVGNCALQYSTDFRVSPKLIATHDNELFLNSLTHKDLKIGLSVRCKTYEQRVNIFHSHNLI